MHLKSTKSLEIDVKLTHENYSYRNFQMVPLLEDEELIDTTAVTIFSGEVILVDTICPAKM
jgi:hypothetical protein